jgi:MFS family permease
MENSNKNIEFTLKDDNIIKEKVDNLKNKVDEDINNYGNNGNIDDIAYFQDILYGKEKISNSEVNYNYSEFLNLIGITKKACIVFMLASFLQFIWGVEACFISINLEGYAKYKNIDPKEKSILISVLFSMMGIGSVLMGLLTKKLGRIKLITFTAIVYTISVSLCSFYLFDDFYYIFIIRCISNISIGIFNISILNLLCEYLPMKNRSFYLMLNSGMYNLGNFFLVMINFIFLKDINFNFDISQWRMINLVCIIPGIFSIFFSIFLVEESPLYLINILLKNQENSEKAYKILSEMASQSKNKVDFNKEIFKSLVDNAKGQKAFYLKSNYSELFNSDYRRLTLCNILICTFCYLNMVGISYITPIVIHEKSKEILDIDFDIQMILYSLIQLPNGYIGGLMTESELFGRKKTIWICSYICGIFYLLIYYYPYYVCFYSGIIMLFNSIAFGAAYIYISEIYPTNLRDQAQSLIQFISFIFGSFSPYIVNSSYTWSINFLAITCFICIFITLIVGEETNMRPLDKDPENIRKISKDRYYNKDLIISGEINKN